MSSLQDFDYTNTVDRAGFKSKCKRYVLKVMWESKSNKWK